MQSVALMVSHHLTGNQKTNERKAKMKKINEVYETHDYSQFKFIGNNRAVSQGHVNRILNSMKKRRLISPIIVNENKEIINGQHRFLAQKELNAPIPFIIQNGYGEKETQILNNNTKNWSMLDWESHYCNKNIEDYLIFRDFRKKYKFPSEANQMLLQGKESDNDLFKDGLFKVDCYNLAIKYADMIYDIGKFFEHYKERMFLRAIVNIFDFGVYKHSEFIKKLSNKGNVLRRCVDKKSYCRNIEDIYNHRTRETNKVRLF